MIKKLKYDVNVGLHLERGDKWVLETHVYIAEGV